MERTRKTGLLTLASILLASAPAAADEPDAPRGAGRDRDDTEEVSIPGTRLVETGGSAHAIGDKQLRRFSYDDPHQVLLSVPGVYVRPEDGFGLRPNIGIRGASSDRSKKITLMEDGVLVGPAPYSAPAAYYFPLIDRMRTVRVIKGPSSIVYGPQTVGGAVDMVTRDIPSRPKATYDLALGQYGFNKQHLTFGTSDERVGVLIEGMRLDNSGFKELDGGGDTGFTRNEWMAKGSFVLDPNARIQNELELKAGYSDEKSNETYLGLTDADARATPNRRYLASRMDRMEWHRTALALTHRVRFSRQLEMSTTAYRHDLHRVWRKVNGFRGASILDVLANPDTPRNQLFVGALTGEVDSATDAQTILVGPNDRTFVSQGVQTQVRAATRTGPLVHRVTYGVRAHYDSIARKHTEDGFLMRGRELVPDGRVTDTTADNEASTHALAMWVVDAVTAGPVTVTPGVRVEAIGFYNDYTNITNLCTFSNGCVGRDVDRQTDGGRARISGAELYGEAEIDLGLGYRLPARASYTYTYTEFLSTFESADPQFGDVRRGDEIPYVPPHQIAGGVGLEKAPWGLNVAGTFVDSMRERAGQGTPPPGGLTDAYFLLDASVKYKLLPGLELYVNGRNLTNDRYIASRRPYGARPGAPLWILVGVRGEL